MIDMLREKGDDILLLTSTQYIEQKEYWINTLSGEITETNILTAGKTSPGTGKVRERIEMVIPDQLSGQLRNLSYGNALTIYVIVLAGLKALIYRYTGNKDVTVISPLYIPEISKKPINDFLFLRDTIHGGMSFKELLLNVRETVLPAYKNQDYPSEKLVEYMLKNSLINTGRISNILCSLRNIHRDVSIGILNASLAFSFMVEEDCVKGYLSYDPAVYNENFVRQLSRHYITLLEIASEDVNKKITDICFFSKEEKSQLVFGFNQNEAGFSREKTIHQLLEIYSEISPGSIAVAFENSYLTYRELNGRANQLARRLRECAIQKDRLVGILLDRSLLMVESIVAAWKAGGAYIPLEREEPRTRIARILKDAGTEVLVTQSQYIDPQLEESFNSTIIKLDKYDTRETGTGSYVKQDLNIEINMNNLAYVIYTSGSTGEPKGAMVEHLGMMNHIQAKINDLQLTENSIVAQNASHTFDISIWQFFAALTIGGKTIIYPYELILEPEDFISRLNRNQVTILEVVPSYLAIILDTLKDKDQAVPLPLNYLLVTGEEVRPLLVKNWFDLYPHIKVVNAYGPTEASDDITHHIMEHVPDVDRIPLGKSLQNLNIYIEDNDGNLCPLGIAGEICVSGVGVGRGYLNNQERTKEVFMEDPFTVTKGIRQYKTGDLGYWLPDGTIEFLGRKDYQVKIRGFRIELGEIESQLLKVDGIKEAVVEVREDSEGSQYLCAFFVPHKKLNTSKLKEYLSVRMPDYMVPDYFVELGEFPLTTNGKIDRKTLPEPAVRTPSPIPYLTTQMLKQMATKSGKEYKEKKSPAEEIIAERALSKEEQEQLLYTFNNTGREYPKEKTLHQLFEEQVEISSGNTSIVYNDEILSYSGLNQKANRLARLLRNKGIKPDSIVGVLTTPSFELMTALLGVLKSGGGYMPIEPEYPEKRIKFLLMNSNTSILLTQRHLLHKISFEFKGEIINLDDFPVYQEDSSNPDDLNRPDDLLHMLYTSGTTGKPKGVLISHQNLVNYITWFSSDIGITPGDKTLLNSSFAYDMCYSSLYSSVLSGGQLHILPVEMYQDPERMLNYIRDNKITFIKLIASHYSVVINSPSFVPGMFKTVRLVVSCGEPINVKDIEKTHRFCSDIKVMNHYGPSECTTGSITQFMDFNHFDLYKKNPTIGKPIYNTQTYILDKNLNLLPVGVTGELCISGDGVSKGYSNQQELTREKFVANPYLPGKKMYRTGDFARWKPNGSIELLGRFDSQVKIKGFRIELNEIENRLLKHDKVKEAVVIPREVRQESNNGNDEDINQYLCAYIVSDIQLEILELKEFLLKDLPAYMVPSFFLSVENLPLTPNGKIDRKALPDPLEIDLGGKNGYVPPRNTVERKLVEIWEKVLNRSSIGINENFFMIGGNSIKAIQIAARMKKEGYQLELQKLFTYQTIKEMTPHVKRSGETNEGIKTGTHGPGRGLTNSKIPGDVLNRLTKKYSPEDIYPLTPMQEGMLFHSLYDNSSSLFINQLSHRFYDEVDLSVVEKSIDEMIKRYDTLRTIFIYGGSQGVEKPLQLVLKERQIKILYEDISEKTAESEKERFIEKFKSQDLQNHFDLSKDLLLRLAIIKLNKSEYEFIWTHHCILMDGWSQSIILLAFTEIYQSHSQGRECQLAPVTPFKTYVEWIEKQDRTKSKKYWEKYLEGYGEMASVPKKPPSRNKEVVFIREMVSVGFNKEKTGVLNRIARQNQISLNIIFQAIWAIILGKYSGKNDVVFGNIVSGRPPEIEGIEAMVGLYTNMIPVRIRFGENTTFSQLLRDIQQNESKSEPHHYYPLVEIQAGYSLKQKLFDHFYVFGNFPISDERPLQEEVGSKEEVRKEFVSKLARVQGFEQTSYDLTIYVTAQEASLIHMAYNKNVYRKDFMKKITVHIEDVIERVIKNENIRIKDFEIGSNLVAVPSMIFDGTQPDFDI
jgi:amino acid adenylation domain-containing protein